ncbi:MAG TPA: hypothetical protein VH684_20185 [Xanthobacteraceae bacterium]|jgi:hypothetical protein
MREKQEPEKANADRQKNTSARQRRPWQAPKVITMDVALTMHGNCGGVDGMFSSS